MKRRLQQIYWLCIATTLITALAAMLLVTKMKIDDTRKVMADVLGTSAAWTLESNSDLQSLAEDIARVSAPIRVTFLMEQGLILADSEWDAARMENHGDRPEIIEARETGSGESLRFSQSEGTFALYSAKRISPQLILRLCYPADEITRLVLMYGLGLLGLFLALFFIQRRSVSRVTDAMMRQVDGVRRVLEGDAERAPAEFPEFQPALDNIAYLAHRLHTDREEVLRTLNLRSDFVANASHELRSPLTSIMGFAEMLDEGMADSPEETALCLSAIRNECERMLSVIEDILHLSHAEADAAPDRQHVSVHGLANEIISALQPQAAHKRISLSADGEMTLFAAEKDLWEILYNLISNAVKYGREDGFVRVLMQDRTLTVEDNGIGIAKEHLPHLFEQFYRVDDARGMTQGGTGLGLSIVKALCARYQADIRVESEPGAGSRFILSFPLIEKEEKTV